MGVECKCKRDSLYEGVSGTVASVVAFPEPSSSPQSHVAGAPICQIVLGSSLLTKAIVVRNLPRLQGDEALDEFDNPKMNFIRKYNANQLTARVNFGSFRVDDPEDRLRAVKPWLQL